MSRSLLACGLFTSVVACSIAASAQEPAPEDEAANVALEAAVEAGLAAMETGDVSFFRATQPEASVYDLGPDGNPVSLYGPEQVNEFLDAFAAMVQGGGTVDLQRSRFECHVVGDLGFCVLESAQTFTMGGETMGPFQFHSTIVMRKVGDAWTTEHLHGSLAEWPAGMMDAPAEEPPAE